MEAKLKKLIEGNKPENRNRWALEWKQQGKKVIGTLCTYLPEEVIYAADMLPWRITGSWGGDVYLGTAYRPPNTCPYCTHVLESFLAREFPFLDGVVTANRDFDTVRLYDVLVHLETIPFTHIVDVPHHNSELAFRQFGNQIQKLMEALEALGSIKITNDALHHAINIYNHQRALLRKVYDLRKKEIPPLSGAEVLGITTAAMVMPKDQFNKELEALLPYLEDRKVPVHRVRPRLLVTGDRMDNPGYLDLIEETGCVVAMDDFDTGSRYFWQPVDMSSDPVHALAVAHINGSGCPRMSFWDQQVNQVVKWVREFRIDGVLELPLAYCYPFAFRGPFFKARMAEKGIPYISFTRDYHITNKGQLRTRIGAFIEMLPGGI